MKKIILAVCGILMAGTSFASEPRIGKLLVDQTYRLEVTFNPQKAQLRLPITTAYTPFEEADIKCNADTQESCRMSLSFNLGKVLIKVYDGENLIGSVDTDLTGFTDIQCTILSDHTCSEELPSNRTIVLFSAMATVNVTNSSNQIFKVDLNFINLDMSTNTHTVTFGSTPGKIEKSTLFDSSVFISETYVNEHRVRNSGNILTAKELAEEESERAQAPIEPRQ